VRDHNLAATQLTSRLIQISFSATDRVLVAGPAVANAIRKVA